MVRENMASGKQLTGPAIEMSHPQRRWKSMDAGWDGIWHHGIGH